MKEQTLRDFYVMRITKVLSPPHSPPLEIELPPAVLGASLRRVLCAGPR